MHWGLLLSGGACMQSARVMVWTFKLTNVLTIYSIGLSHFHVREARKMDI